MSDIDPRDIHDFVATRQGPCYCGREKEHALHKPIRPASSDPKLRDDEPQFWDAAVLAALHDAFRYVKDAVAMPVGTGCCNIACSVADALILERRKRKAEFVADSKEYWRQQDAAK